jgi:type IV pilus assembly protein PilV
MKTQSGFTLIEVLVAVVLLAGGLLGMAELQAMTIKYNLSAYNRSMATQLAYDMADRIRANKVDSSNLSTSTYSTITLAGAKLQPSCEPTTSPSTTACTPAKLAQHDVAEWYATVTTLLPGSSGSTNGVKNISIQGNSASHVFTITISWNDTHDSTASAYTTFQTSFQLL